MSVISVYRRFIFLTLILFTVSLSASTAKTPSNDPSQTAKSNAHTQIKSMLEEADKLFIERRDPEKARNALSLYRKLYQAQPKNSEFAYRVSMACYFVGIRLTSSAEEKEKIYAEGRDAGIQGIENSIVRKKRIRRIGRRNDDALPESDCAACYFWTAINMALYGQTVGVFKMLFSLKDIQGYLQDSIKLDPTYAEGGAYRLLGKIEHSLPGVLGGSDGQSEKYYQAALKYGPDEPLNYLFYARLLNEAMDKPKKALEIAEKGLTVPKPSVDRIESLDSLDDLKKLVGELRTKLGIKQPAQTPAPQKGSPSLKP